MLHLKPAAILALASLTDGEMRRTAWIARALVPVTGDPELEFIAITVLAELVRLELVERGSMGKGVGFKITDAGRIALVSGTV